MLIFSIIGFSIIDNSYADEIIAKSIGFEDSTILELKNSRGNIASIESVRIWLSEGNEFKSFKTEQGWTGKNTPQGVIIFTTSNAVKPGDDVKFGIKTTEISPTINWKALDSNGEVISSASIRITEVSGSEEKPGLNQPINVGIKEESNFRFIPEKPASNSNFRVIGENFIPNQKLDFYIEDKLYKTISVDGDGKILFTSKTPTVLDGERTEFILRDSGGMEKSISIRIPESFNREIADVIKLSLGNTPQEVKRGDTITLEGMATPNTTLTIASKYVDGDILAIDTIQVGFDGRWSYDNLFMPDLDLGTISIEIDDGKSKALRNFEVISAKLINISSIETSYEPGDSVPFIGKAIPNIDASIILEDGIGTEIFSRIVSVGESGNIDFNIEIPRGSVEGTYVLYAFQGNEEGIATFGVGQEPEPILVLRPSKLNFSSEDNVQVTIQGTPNAQVSIILIDSADREKLSDTINLGPDGKEVYLIDASDLPTGAFTMNAKRGESSGSAVFTIGLTTGSGSITVQTTRDEYKQGEQMLILGNTGAVNVLLDITIINPEEKVIKKVETFSDRFGVFKVDNFRIPVDGLTGVWKINAKSGGNFDDIKFEVVGDTAELEIITDKESYEAGERVNISGKGARMSATVTIKIFDSEGEKIDELNITATSKGSYATIWQIPRDIDSGEYEMVVDDGATNRSTVLKIN